MTHPENQKLSERTEKDRVALVVDVVCLPRARGTKGSGSIGMLSGELADLSALAGLRLEAAREPLSRIRLPGDDGGIPQHPRAHRRQLPYQPIPS